jgi:hypothetical protein
LWDQLTSRCQSNSTKYPTTTLVFYGSIAEVVRDPLEDEEGVHQNLTLQCLDPLQKARCNGVNLSLQTKTLMMDIEFEGADFSAEDPNFLVYIPTDSVADGYEFVPQMLHSLKCVYTRDGEQVVHEYGKDEYSYGSNNKLIYFHESQVDQKAGSGTWTGRVYYYDPDDFSNSVKNLLIAVFTGDPRSEQGGLGFDVGDLDFEEIVGYASNPKVIRSLIREKIDGPVTQLLDELRENGLLPYNYRIYYDPVDRKVKGRYVYQLEDVSSVPTPAYGVFDYSNAATMEGVFGRAEVWGQAVTPRNYALGASVTLNGPGGNYPVKPTGADGSEIVDGRGDTMCNFQYTSTSIFGLEPSKTPNNCWLVDLGCDRPIRTVMLRSFQAVTEGWGDVRPHRCFFIERNQRVTVSGSKELIDANDEGNPGIPVSDDAVNFEIDYENQVNEWHRFECDHITEGRYYAVRCEQDVFFRNERGDPGDHTIERTSAFTLAEIKLLGDGRHRYEKIIVDGTAYDHPDKGQVPYAEVKGVDDVTTIAAVTDTTHFTLTDTDFVDVGGFLQVKHGTNEPVLVRVSAKDPVSKELTVAPAVPGVAVDDPAGEYNRWMMGWDYAYYDFYFPKLRQKLANTTEWLEILDNDDVAEIEDAEMSAVDQLLTGIMVVSDNKTEIPLDIAQEVGETTRPYDDEEPFLITDCTTNLNQVNDEERPAVTQTLEGTNFQEEAA